MSARGSARGDSAEFNGNDFVIEEGDEPAHGTNETLRLAGTPVHTLGPVKRGDFFGHEFGEKLEGGAAFANDVGGNILTLGRGGGSELADFDSNFLGEGNGGLGGLAIFVSVGCAGAEELLGNVWLRGLESVGDDGDAARDE